VVKDPINLEVAKMVGKDEVKLLLEDDVISRIIAQTCRQSGLSVIYQEILDYAGDEMYFTVEPGLTGKTFGEALFCYEDSSLLGIMKKGRPSKLAPPMDTIIEEGDQVICISEDETTMKLSGIADYKIDESVIQESEQAGLKPEKTLILGWNSRTSMIINQLENYVAEGSTVTVVAEKAEVEEQLRKDCCNLEKQGLDFITGDVTDRRLLEKLEVQQYNHTILLSNTGLSPQQADSRMLITLLHLRNIAVHCRKNFSIVSEMIDPNNCRLAAVARADDFIVGTRLISFLLTQISENKLLGDVFAEVFDAEGAEIYLKPAMDYIKTGVEINFYTLLESARRKNEAAIGYRLRSKIDDRDNAFGVVINPDKSEKFVLGEKDRVIVVAEN